MKGKNFIIAGAGLIIFAVILFSVLNVNKVGAVGQTTSKSGNVLGNELPFNGEVQEVKLYMKDYKYVTEPAVLKKGVPVRMTVDTKTVVGCAADVTIKEFGVRKYVRPGDNIITFTPTKTGTITIACSMNMFFGSFQVVDDSNPNAPAEVTASIPQSSGGSCGAGSGKCGCGGRL
ncbi:MAG: hypothetical protein KatS3mg002_0666 [Candidatus Woesearchaeota archaeon]|nr:MAG: hypothetical protein KatS3mg002_0666 [Candidatus Woesearchaeota archaeon]